MRIHINVEALDKEVIDIARNVTSFCGKLKTDLGSAAATAIEAMFPEATPIDQACQKLCTEAVAGCNAIKAALPAINNAADQINAIFLKLNVDLVAAQHGSKKNLGYYLRAIGSVIEDLAGFKL